LTDVFVAVVASPLTLAPRKREAGMGSSLVRTTTALIKPALMKEEASKLFARHPYPDFIACQHWARENGVNE
jgi:hypothetical protein